MEILTIVRPAGSIEQQVRGETDNMAEIKDVKRDNTLLSVEGLKVHFPVREGILRKKQIGVVKAVDGLDFSIRSNETFGLVGESGCGKSTTGRAILRLIESTEGSIYYKDKNLTKMTQKEMMPLRRDLQMIFQDPYASLNPRQPVIDIISDPLIAHSMISKSEKQDKVAQLMELVGLNPRFMNRFPHEFSGGQRQRIGIARSLALNAKFIVCDEPIAALDVSIQAQVINLLQDIQDKLGLTYLFIAHDLSVVRHISDRIAVMYLGKIVEITGKKELFQNPQHMYTKTLLSAVPIADPAKERKRTRIITEGEVPSPLHKPQGCAFSSRCPYAKKICREQEPELKKTSEEHWTACWEVQ